MKQGFGMDKPPETSACGCGDNGAVNRRAGLGCAVGAMPKVREDRSRHTPPDPPEEPLSQRESPLTESSFTDISRHGI